jgi:hypothetical protein
MNVFITIFAIILVFHMYEKLNKVNEKLDRIEQMIKFMLPPIDY